MRRTSVVLSLTAAAALMAAPLASAPLASATAENAPVTRAPFSPGDNDANDAYVGTLGNGGYDVRHYDLDVRYQPSSDRLWGTTTIRAVATQNLSRFNLDLQGLTVRSVVVNGIPVSWSRNAGELRITPKHGIRDGSAFTAVIVYDGIPQTLPDGSGFVHTDDGALVIGEPQVAATWFPVNDHPSDKASYHVDVTVPQGLTAVSNGVLQKQSTKAGWTTWTWDAPEPMASYLATATIGKFDLKSYQHKGIRMWEAVDPALYEPIAAPRTGQGVAASQQADSSYKRLTRTVAVPAGGGALSFWVTRDTEPGWDFFFVEARPAGGSAWTTLPDRNGHTSTDTGDSCPSWFRLHPFLKHYQTSVGSEPARGGADCRPSGTTGRWNAASGASNGYEHWSLDLSAYAGRSVELSFSYASDGFGQGAGVVIDDVRTPTGAGSTSFEADGHPLDGWRASGPPAGSPANENDWVAGGANLLRNPVGVGIDASFARNGETIDFLASQFGPYPFSASGGIVDNDPSLGFALENQTRPIYSKDFFGSPEGNSSVIAHELAHQWFGDSLAVEKWRHIWLNEGFATYAEWLWSQHEGGATPAQIFDQLYRAYPADSSFWTVVIGNPGADRMFDGAVYTRGAMTLQALREAVGDRHFFTILRSWARSHRDGNTTTAEFVRLSERVAGQQLDGLFRTWLFTPRKPVLGDAGARVDALPGTAVSGAAAVPRTSAVLELRKPGLTRD